MRRVENLFRSGLVNIAFQVVILTVLFVVGNNTRLDLEGVGKDVVLLAFVLVPSFVWTLFFYLQDRREPEPTSYLTTAFLAGMAGASLFAWPLTSRIFSLDQWLYSSQLSFLLGSVLVVGAITSSVYYVVIRYGFFPLREFDEPVDGMVYGAFIGSGYAAIKSLSYLAAHTEFTLFAMGYTTTKNILVYASIDSLVGYLIGRVKFTGGNQQTASATAVALGAFLIGAYQIVNEFIFLRGLEQTFLVSFVLTIAFATIILGVAFVTARRLTRTGSCQSRPFRSQPDLLAIGLILVLLIGGGLARNHVMRQIRFTHDGFNISFAYQPYMFTSASFGHSRGHKIGAGPLDAQIFNRRGHHDGEFHFSVNARRETVETSTINTLDYLGNIATTSLLVSEIEVGNQKALQLKYSYLHKPTTRDREFPELYLASSTIIPAGEITFVLTFQTQAHDYESTVEVYRRILETVRFNGP
ncbi:MAG: PrsW family glutamic-type intramembrane protease [bacterium]